MSALYTVVDHGDDAAVVPVAHDVVGCKVGYDVEFSVDDVVDSDYDDEAYVGVDGACDDCLGHCQATFEILRGESSL